METKEFRQTRITSDTIESIYQRRAIRKYKNKPVEPKLIEAIIDAGRMAPSAINKQPWKFYVLTNRTIINSFAKEIAGVMPKRPARVATKGAARTGEHLLHFSESFHFETQEDPIFHGAPIVIFITGPRDNEWASLDIGMCSENMMLAAKSLGLDSCPVGLGKYVENTTIFEKLKVPPLEEVKLAIIFGYGDESPELHERRKDNVMFIE
jgi:nitroreductase